MHHTLVATRRSSPSRISAADVAWAAAGAVAFVATAVSMLAVRHASSSGFGAAAHGWLSDLGFGLLVTGIPAATVSILLVVAARALPVGRFSPATASAVAVAAAYGLVAAITVIAAFPAWFPVSIAVAGAVVTIGVHRSTAAA